MNKKNEIKFLYDNLTNLLKDPQFPKAELMGIVCEQLSKFPYKQQSLTACSYLMGTNNTLKMNTNIQFLPFLSKRSKKVKYVNLIYCKRMLLLTRYWTKWYNIDLNARITKDVKWFKPMIRKSYWINHRIKNVGFIIVRRLIKHWNYLKTNKLINLAKLNELMGLLEKQFPLIS